jgi:hypothetical protein
MNAVVNRSGNNTQIPIKHALRATLGLGLGGIAIGLSVLPGLLSGAIAQTPSAPEVARLIEVRGTVKIRRQAITPSQPPQWIQARLGEQIRRGDLLRVERNAKAVIRCTTYQSITWTVPNDGIPWGATSVCSPPANAR